ncbi:hypothetical protein [Methylocella sp.]|jgi:hypothetical protein|uniref:hypothetical protein n=1 Tax=Methylocella sp. TaxID=1978226 RepID=UPI003C27310C
MPRPRKVVDSAGTRSSRPLIGGARLLLPTALFCLIGANAAFAILEQNSIATSSPFAASTAPVTLSPGDCAVLVKTYRGIFSAGAIASYDRAMDNPALKQQAVIEFSKDPDAAIKSRIGHEQFPDHLIELRDYDVLDQVTLPSWSAEDLRRAPKDLPGSGED